MLGGTIQADSNFLNKLRRKIKIKAQKMFYDNYIWVFMLVPANLMQLNVASTTSLSRGITPKLHALK
jgi:hypothetical protein